MLVNLFWKAYPSLFGIFSLSNVCSCQLKSSYVAWLLNLAPPPSNNLFSLLLVFFANFLRLFTIVDVTKEYPKKHPSPYLWWCNNNLNHLFSVKVMMKSQQPFFARITITWLQIIARHCYKTHVVFCFYWCSSFY